MKTSTLLIVILLAVSFIPLGGVDKIIAKEIEVKSINAEAYVAYIVNETEAQIDAEVVNDCDCDGDGVVEHGDGHKTPCTCIPEKGKCDCVKKSDTLKETVDDDNYITDKYNYVVYHFGAEWCGPCQMLKKNTWQNKDLQSFFQDKKVKLFIFDDGVVDEKKYFSFYKINRYPTVLFFKSNDLDQPLARHIGYVDANTMINRLKQVINE